MEHGSQTADAVKLIRANVQLGGPTDEYTHSVLKIDSSDDDAVVA